MNPRNSENVYLILYYMHMVALVWNYTNYLEEIG